LATSEDFFLATCGDFLMAMDTVDGGLCGSDQLSHLDSLRFRSFLLRAAMTRVAVVPAKAEAPSMVCRETATPSRKN